MESPARSAQPKQNFHRVKAPSQAVRAEGVQLLPGVGEGVGQGIRLFGGQEPGGFRFLPAALRAEKGKQARVSAVSRQRAAYRTLSLTAGRSEKAVRASF